MRQGKHNDNHEFTAASCRWLSREPRESDMACEEEAHRVDLCYKPPPGEWTAGKLFRARSRILRSLKGPTPVESRVTLRGGFVTGFNISNDVGDVKGDN